MCSLVSFTGRRILLPLSNYSFNYSPVEFSCRQIQLCLCLIFSHKYTACIFKASQMCFFSSMFTSSLFLPAFSWCFATFLGRFPPPAVSLWKSVRPLAVVRIYYFASRAQDTNKMVTSSSQHSSRPPRWSKTSQSTFNIPDRLTVWLERIPCTRPNVIIVQHEMRQSN